MFAKISKHKRWFCAALTVLAILLLYGCSAAKRAVSAAVMLSPAHSLAGSQLGIHVVVFYRQIGDSVHVPAVALTSIRNGTEEYWNTPAGVRLRGRMAKDLPYLTTVHIELTNTTSRDVVMSQNDDALLISISGRQYPLRFGIGGNDGSYPKLLLRHSTSEFDAEFAEFQHGLALATANGPDVFGSYRIAATGTVVPLELDVNDAGSGERKASRDDSTSSVVQSPSNAPMSQSYQAAPPTLDYYSNVGEIRGRTADPTPHTIICDPVLAYPLGDKALQTELIQRTPLLQSIILTYFIAKSSAQLEGSAAQTRVKAELRDEINRVLAQGKISEVLFSAYDVVEF